MKKNLLMVFMLLVGIAFMSTVEASECSLSEKSTLKKYAAYVKVTYESGQEEETIQGEENATNLVNYLYMKVLNLNSSLRVVVKNNNNDAEVNLTYRNMGPNGEIVLKQKASDMIITYTFEIYGDISTNCYTEKLTTIKMSLPKYNNLSALEMCESIPDYYLCKQYVDYSINSNTATDLILAYKEKLSNKDDSVIVENNTSTVSKALSEISRFKYLIAGAIVVIGVIITIVIVKKRRNMI